PWLAMPPPPSWVESANPPLIVSPLNVRLSLAATSKMREVWPALIVSWPAPGPLIVMFFLMDSSPLVSVMVWPSRLGVKTMVSPSWALLMTFRSEPEPLSLLLVTVSVLSSRRSSSTASVGRHASRCRREPCARRRSLDREDWRLCDQDENHMRR